MSDTRLDGAINLVEQMIGATFMHDHDPGDEHHSHQRAAHSGEHILALPFHTAPCQCVADHRPLPLIIELHHKFPQAEQKKVYGRIVDNERVALCSNSHDSVHVVLTAMLAGKPYPRVNPYILGIAREGYRRIKAAAENEVAVNQ